MHEARIRVHAGGRSAVVGRTELVVGRSAYCTLIVDDPSVSRVHASFRLVAEARCELTDLGSSNGTYVNGKRLGATPVIVGLSDLVEVGDVTLQLEEAAPILGGTITARGMRAIEMDWQDEANTGVGRKPGARGGSP